MVEGYGEPLVIDVKGGFDWPCVLLDARGTEGPNAYVQSIDRTVPVNVPVSVRAVVMKFMVPLTAAPALAALSVSVIVPEMIDSTLKLRVVLTKLLLALSTRIYVIVLPDAVAPSKNIPNKMSVESSWL